MNPLTATLGSEPRRLDSRLPGFRSRPVLTLRRLHFVSRRAAPSLDALSMRRAGRSPALECPSMPGESAVTLTGGARPTPTAGSPGPTLRSGDIFFVVWKARYPQAFRRKLSTSDPNPFITLNQPVRVRGSVVDAETGRPIDTFDVVPGETSELPCSAGFEVISALFLVCVEVDSACGTKHPSDGASLP